MSNTPRTDDQSVRYYDDATGTRIEYVAARFARQLERELAQRERELAEAREQSAKVSAVKKNLVDANKGAERNMNALNICCQKREELERERDGWREAAYALGEALPPSWEEQQPPAAQLAKFKEMVQLQNNKYKL